MFSTAKKKKKTEEIWENNGEMGTEGEKEEKNEKRNMKKRNKVKENRHEMKK